MFCFLLFLFFSVLFFILELFLFGFCFCVFFPFFLFGFCSLVFVLFCISFVVVVVVYFLFYFLFPFFFSSLCFLLSLLMLLIRLHLHIFHPILLKDLQCYEAYLNASWVWMTSVLMICSSFRWTFHIPSLLSSSFQVRAMDPYTNIFIKWKKISFLKIKNKKYMGYLYCLNTFCWRMLVFSMFIAWRHFLWKYILLTAVPVHVYIYIYIYRIQNHSIWFFEVKEWSCKILIIVIHGRRTRKQPCLYDLLLVYLHYICFTYISLSLLHNLFQFLPWW